MFTVYSNHNPFFPFIQPIFIHPHIQLNIIIILQLCLLRLSKILYTSSYHPPFFHIFPQQDCVTSTTVHVTVIWNLSRRLSSLSPIYHLLSLFLLILASPSFLYIHIYYTYILFNSALLAAALKRRLWFNFHLLCRLFGQKI